MSTTGHENEAINVQGLKASLKKGGNIGIYNEVICSTAGATAAKVTNTTPPSFSLVPKAKIIVKFTYAISVANATLQVGANDTAKPIYFQGAPLAANIIKAGTSVLLSYDGTSFNIIGGLGTQFTAGDGLDLTNETFSVDETVARYDPNSSQQVTVPDYAPGTYIGECTTAASTAAKEATVLSYELMNRSSIAMKFTNGISVANATLNVNSKGAKAIYFKGAALAADVIGAGDIALLQYDGTRFNVISIEGAPRYAQVTGKSYYSMTI